MCMFVKSEGIMNIISRLINIICDNIYDYQMWRQVLVLHSFIFIWMWHEFISVQNFEVLCILMLQMHVFKTGHTCCIIYDLWKVEHT